MNKTGKQHNWSVFFKTFSRQNEDRATRIGIFEGEPGVMTDYWIEDGLRLKEVAIDERERAAPTVEIMLGNSEKPGLRHLTHIVSETRFVRIVLSADGLADGLDIEDTHGRTTILRFEN